MDTVGELIEKLKTFPSDMPVRICQKDGCRDGEFWSINSVDKKHLKMQNTDGDPEEYWNDPKDLDPEDKLQPGHSHYKYKGKLILIS